MKLTRKEALNLHRWMWMDIQKVLGDNPTPAKRVQFKEKWCREHFPEDRLLHGTKKRKEINNGRNIRIYDSLCYCFCCVF